MIRYFENQDKYGILELASEYHGDSFDLGTFAGLFDDIVNGSEQVKGIAILHAGEYLGYALVTVSEKALTYSELYVKPKFQKLGVSPQVFDFTEAEFPDYSYNVLIPSDNRIARKVFERRGYNITLV